jgi:cytochrome c
MKNDPSRYLRARMHLVMLVALSSLAGMAQAASPQALLQRYKCDICHARDQVRTGPAYVDVAAKYRGNAQAPARLEAAVRSGAHGSGPWPMPPHPEVSAADARTMVRYILSLKK